MYFCVLGPLDVVGPAGPIAIKGEKPRGLLAALLLHARRPVSVDRLSAALWGPRPPQSALANLRTYAHQIRKALGPEAGDLLTTQPSAYLLDVGPDQLDLLEFEALSDAGMKALRDGDSSTAAEHLGAALRLWRGRPLEGLELESWTRGRLAALEDRRWAALSAWVDASLAMGWHDALVPRLREVVAEQPLSERTWIQLIRALHGSGRTGDALEAYDQARRILADELGLEPCPDLRRVHVNILRGIAPPTGLAGHAHAGPVAASPPAWSGALSDVAGFVGRLTHRNAVVDLGRAVATRRQPGPPAVVSIAGGPGIGKSTLAARLAYDLSPTFPEGVCYLSLAAARSGNGEDSLTSQLAGLVPRERRQGTEIAGDFRAWLAGRRMVVVLDDAVDAQQVSALLPQTSPGIVLVTSRTTLGLEDVTYHVSLDPLPTADGVDLLCSMVGPGRVLAEFDAAVRIISACEGTPLAIRIAGTRLLGAPHMSLGTLAQRLRLQGHRLDELTTDKLTVRTSLQRTYAVLSSFARRTLQTLGAAGRRDVTVVDLVSLLNIPISAAEVAVQELKHHHLLKPIAESDQRYRIGELMLDYACERAAVRDPVGIGV